MKLNKKLSNGHLLVLGLAFGSAFGVPRGYRVVEKKPAQPTTDKLRNIDAANAKRARKAERNRKAATT